jgi:hypothetical protein
MLVTIHQPEHLPWPGLLNKVMQVDKFVILDTVQYRKNYFHNRNKICTKGGIKWLTLPIEKYNHGTLIKDILIDRYDKHFAKWLRVLKLSYGDFPYYDDIRPAIELIYGSSDAHLASFNISLIKFMLDYLKIQTKCVLASELCLLNPTDATDMLLNICEALGAEKYLSGPSGKNYLDVDRFHSNGIDVIFHEYSPVSYKHPHACFTPGISFIDAMMLYGADSRQYLISNASL